MINKRENAAKDVGNMQLTLLYDGESIGEVSEEFSLPDYQAEVSRIVCVRPQFLLENKYISDTGSGVFLEIGGTVTYSVIYTDDEGELYCVPLSSTYETKIPLSEMAEHTELSFKCESTSFRATAPRRLTLKTKLRCRVRAFKELKVESKITPASFCEEIYLERCEKTALVPEIKEISLKNVKMSETLGTLGGSVKPIWCDAYVSLGEVRCENGYVKASGEATVKCLVSTEIGEDVVEKRMKLAEEIEADGAEVGDMIGVLPICTALSLSSEEKEGETCLYFDLTCDLVGQVIRNSEKQLLADAYSTKHNSTATYKELEYLCALKTSNTSVSVLDEKKRSQRDGETVVCTIGDAFWEKTESKGTKACHIGKLSVGVIMKCDSTLGNEKYSLETYELPIKYEEELSRASKSVLPICDFSLGALVARCENERIIISAEVYASTSIYEKCTEKILSELNIKTDEEIKNERACVRVCFPREGEALWDVCKRYHAPLAKICAQNELERNTTTLPKYLII